MLWQPAYTLTFAVLLSIGSGHVLNRATSCLKCGGCAFQLRASGTGISYIDGAYATLGNFAGGQPYYFAAFSSGSGTTFKLDTTCHLVAQPTNATAQVFSGADNKNHALYFQKGTAIVGGKTLVQATCAISTATATANQLSCIKAGSDTGLSFYVSRGTVENGQYEIGQELLVLGKSSDVATGYKAAKLTAIQA